MTEPCACFVTASGQSPSFRQLVTALSEALEERGVPTIVAVDHFPSLSNGLVYVFCPHEYLPLTHPEAHPSGAQIGRSVVLNTEPPGTERFKENALAAKHAGIAVDVNRPAAEELRRRGISTHLLRLGYVPAWDRWRGSDFARITDVTFLGEHSDRRARVLASCGPILKDWRAVIHLVETTLPSTDYAQLPLGEAKWTHLAASKVILSIHRDEHEYFEWPSVAAAMINGCVVVSEHSVGVEPLVPGEHFVSVSPESIPQAVGALLLDQERLLAMRTATYALLREELPLSGSIPALADAIEEAAKRPMRPSRAYNPVPLPVERPEPPPEWVRLLSAPDGTDLMRMALKRLVVGQQQLERRLARLENGGSPPADRVTTFGPYDEVRPKVTVAVSLYNYEGFISEALTSVAASDLVEIDVVLVDDASTDGSLAAAEATLHELPWLAGMIVARGANHGLPAARNLAIEHARAPYVFILDADNAVYPHALGRLAECLDADPDAAFAYGILEKFDAGGPYDLVSWLPWDPKRLRYGNFVDAMSLVRRSAFAEVGGYTTDARLGGWEDLALWCAFAEAGLRGTRVPEIVARYRSGRHSMISITNIDASEAWSVLLERFPVLRSG